MEDLRIPKNSFMKNSFTEEQPLAFMQTKVSVEASQQATFLELQT